MREIKFRGKRLDNGEWVIGSLFNSIWVKSADHSPICNIFPDDMLDPDGDCWEDFASVADDYEVDPATVGQFTGLLDKNGKEIYEGDVVRMFYPDNLFIDDTGRIEFDNGCFNFHYIDCDCRLRTKDLNSGGLLTQIAGTIHETPNNLKPNKP